MALIPRGALPYSKDIVAYWPLIESSPGTAAVSRFDAGGRGFTLTDNNTVGSSQTEGVQLQEANLQSANSEFLSMSVTDGSINFTGNYSLYVMLRRRASQGAYMVIAGNLTGNTGWHGGFDNGNKQIMQNDNLGVAAGNKTFTSQTDINSMGWVWDGTNARFYFDGSAEAVVAHGNPTISANPVRIGRSTIDERQLDAAVRLVVVWSSRALSVNEMTGVTRAFKGPEILVHCG